MACSTIVTRSSAAWIPPPTALLRDEAPHIATRSNTADSHAIRGCSCSKQQPAKGHGWQVQAGHRYPPP